MSDHTLEHIDHVTDLRGGGTRQSEPSKTINASVPTSGFCADSR
jgi:hypothetical protein